MKKIRNNKIEKIIEIIKKNNSFLITAHMNLEGDALGSELALYFILKRFKKKVIICNHDSTPEAYNFLPGHRFIKNEVGGKKFDVAFVLDCSDLSRSGSVEAKIAKQAFVVNIDHHISNTRFGDINWLEPKASSVCEMIYHLARGLKVMDKKIALCLYTGIFTDTGNFIYTNTTSDTHKVAASLMGYDICPHEIYRKIHSLCLPEDIKFIGRHISQLKFSSDRKICWVMISRWQERKYDLTEITFSIMRRLKDPLVFIIFKKVGKERTRVNFRSHSKIDVNKIAKFFGGGGHQRASGTTIAGSLKDSEKRVISFVSDFINAAKKRN